MRILPCRLSYDHTSILLKTYRSNQHYVPDCFYHRHILATCCCMASSCRSTTTNTSGLYRWGRLGPLPMHSEEPCRRHFETKPDTKPRYFSKKEGSHPQVHALEKSSRRRKESSCECRWTFPDLFRTSRPATVIKGMRLWRLSSSFIGEEGNVNMRGSEATYRRVTETGSERGSKGPYWSWSIVKLIARRFAFWFAVWVRSSVTPWSEIEHENNRAINLLLISESTNSSYSANTLHPGTAHLIVAKVKPIWAQEFWERFRTVSIALNGKLQLSLEKEEHICKWAAYHLGTVFRDLRSGQFMRRI